MANAIYILRNSGSVYPASYTVIQEDAGWSTVYPIGRDNPNVYLHTCELAVSGTRVLLGAFAPSPAMASRITTFASSSSNAWTLAELKTDQTLLATRLKTYLPQVSGTIYFAATSMMGHDYPGKMERGE